MREYPDVSALIHKIEEQSDLEQKEDMQAVFLQRLNALPKYEYRERGICLYYILRIILSTHQHYETTQAQKYYEKMLDCFRAQHRKYGEKRTKKLHKNTRTRIDHFYRLMERVFSSLEVLYDQKDFIDAVRRAYEEKMYYRKYSFLFRRQYLHFGEYTFLDITCKYGNSFFRWGLTALSFALFLSGIYYLLDLSSSHELKMVTSGNWYDYIYFSIITFTSLGYGDITPTTPLLKFLASFEVFFGFIMLGVFVNLIQKKL